MAKALVLPVENEDRAPRDGTEDTRRIEPVSSGTMKSELPSVCLLTCDGSAVLTQVIAASPGSFLAREAEERRRRFQSTAAGPGGTGTFLVKGKQHWRM